MPGLGIGDVSTVLVPSYLINFGRVSEGEAISTGAQHIRFLTSRSSVSSSVPTDVSLPISSRRSGSASEKELESRHPTLTTDLPSEASELQHAVIHSVIMGARTSRFRKSELLDSSGAVDGSRDLKLSRTAEEAVFSHPAAGSGSMVEGTELLGRSSSSIDEQIQRSKCHWSETVKLKLSDAEDDDDDEGSVEESDCGEEEELARVKADNLEVFKALLSHPTWGNFFRIFGDDEGFDRCSVGSLEVGEKFAEGGQAKLYHAHVVWRDAELNEQSQKDDRKWVLKVFKKGTLLRHLQMQWPQGLMEFESEKVQLIKLGKLLPLMYTCDVNCGTLLEDGRFAFLLKRQQGDLRTLIDDRMRMNGGPFEKDFAEQIMYCVALGVDWLHNRNIVHRDLKASNVLYTCSDRDNYFYVADFECSVGVVGTGFFRAPEILQALKDKNIFQKLELFSKEADVYAYGMTCYEILTGKLPFGNHKLNDYDHVLNGQRPEVPEYVDDWAHELLSRCWQSSPSTRPGIGEILDLILANSTSARKAEADIKEAIKRIEKERLERLKEGKEDHKTTSEVFGQKPTLQFRS